MNRSIQKTLLVTGLGLALLSTGCMTSPGNGEYVGHRAEPVEFGGFVMEPSELIRIDARHPTLGWRTIGWTRSERHAYNWNGQQWYPWQRTLRVPSIYWDSLVTVSTGRISERFNMRRTEHLPLSRVSLDRGLSLENHWARCGPIMATARLSRSMPIIESHRPGE